MSPTNPAGGCTTAARRSWTPSSPRRAGRGRSVPASPVPGGAGQPSSCWRRPKGKKESVKRRWYGRSSRRSALRTDATPRSAGCNPPVECGGNWFARSVLATLCYASRGGEIGRRKGLKIPWEATPVQVRVLPSALRRARPRRDRVRARRRRDRVVDEQVDGHAHAPPMQPGRPEQGLEDPVLGGLVEGRVGALHDPDRRGLNPP